MTAEPELLEVRGLGVDAGRRPLLRGLDLRIRAGETWGLLGPNGSGKTSLLHTLAGLRQPAAGEILFGGKPLHRLSRREAARRIGIMLQNEDYVFPVSVLERVLAGRHPHLPALAWESAADIRQARELLVRLDLEGFEDRSVLTLSGGERRRLQIAALLCQAPQLALLDEPENDLDIRHQSRALGELIAHFTQPGHALLIASHDINLARRHCSHLILLDSGGISTGRTAELATAERLSGLYGCSIRELRAGADVAFVGE